MDGGRSFVSNQFGEHEDSENSPENSGDSPRSAVFHDSKMASSISSPKRSRRALQKRVVSIPIKDVEGRLKGEVLSTPPSDSWAWRKYGQKPIKGSPYPRGYYRCSSSKGCPARKQVERSREDPKMLLVTYSCEHNHPWPASRNNHHTQNHHNNNSAASTTAATTTAATVSISKSEQDQEAKPEPVSLGTSSQQQQPETIHSEEKFGNLGEATSLMSANEFGWFTDFESATSSTTMLESPILAEDARVNNDADMSTNFFSSMREEDESLFADLGELPECSMVFRRGMMAREAESRRHSLTPWCGTTG